MNKGGRITDRRINPQTVYDVLRRRGEEARTANLFPHDFRRTLIGDYLDEGVGIATVSSIVGHSSPTTTARYDYRGEKAKKKAAAMRAVPYVRPEPPEKEK